MSAYCVAKESLALMRAWDELTAVVFEAEKLSDSVEFSVITGISQDGDVIVSAFLAASRSSC